MRNLLATLAVMLALPLTASAAIDPQCAWTDDPSVVADSTWALVDLADGTPTVKICTPLHSDSGFRYSDDTVTAPYPVTSCTLQIGSTTWAVPTTKPGELIEIVPTAIVFTPQGSNTGEVWCSAGPLESTHTTIGMVVVPVSEPPGGPFRVTQ